MYKRIKAFTLAEILITLSIIGVIASMTIPGLVQDIQDAQYKTAWKKAYADLSQVTKRLLMDHGGNFKNICADDYDCIVSKFSKYITYSKYCGQDKGLGNCWHNEINTLNNTKTSIDIKTGGFILTNGMLLAVLQDSGMIITTCKVTGGLCGSFYVDVNGWKGPNTIGRDIYKANLYTNTTQPDKSNSCNSTSTGWGCSAEYLYK